MISFRSSLIKNSLFAISAQGVRGFGAVGISLLIANGFTAAEFGDFRFFQLTVAMLTAVAASGIIVVSTKYFAQASNPHTDEIPPIAHLWIVSLLLAVLVAGACFFLPGTLYGQSGPELKPLFVAIVFVVSANFLPMGALIGMSRFFQVLVVEIVSLIIFGSGALYAIWSHNLIIAFGAMLLSTAVALAINSYMAARALGISTIRRSFGELSFKAAIAKVLSTFGPMSFVGISVAATFWGVGWIIRTSNDDPLIFALYSIGMQWFILANIVPDVLGRVIFPRVVQVTEGDGSGRWQLLRLSVAGALISSIGVALFALIFSPFIVQLYGQQYASAPALIGIYAAVAIPYGVANMVAYAILADNGERYCMAIYFVQLVLAIATVFWFAVSGEFAGAAALFAGSFAALITSILIAKKRGLLPQRFGALFRI